MRVSNVEEKERLQTTVDSHRKSQVVLNDAIAVEIYTAKHGKSRHDAQRLAKRFGVTAKAIRDIWRRRTWTRATRHLWCPDNIRKIKGSLTSRNTSWNLQHEQESDILQVNCAVTASQPVFTDVYFDEDGWLMDPRVIRFFISN
jgi:hypothetical protein